VWTLREFADNPVISPVVCRHTKVLEFYRSRKDPGIESFASERLNDSYELGES